MLIGAMLAAWEVQLNADLQHGLRWLALLRLLAKASAGGLAGACASLAIVLLAWRAPWGARIAGVVVALGVAWLALPTLVPSVRWLYGLVHFSSTGISVLAIGSMAAAGLLLLGLRATDFAGARSGTRPRRHRSRQRAAWLALVALTLVLAADRIGVRAFERAAGEGPSVVLVSLDTLRADRLGVLGNPRPLTPHLDQLAAEGALFTQATAPSPWTLPSHTSVFTSLLPYDHLGHRKWVPPRPSLLGERFRDAGYRTGAFTGAGFVHGNRGFRRGFEVYVSVDELESGGSADYLARAVAWVESLEGAPFFLFVHTYEPHTPYLRQDFADARDAGRVGDSFDAEDLRATRRGDVVLTLAERRFVTDLYDGDVAHTDQLIGGFLGDIRHKAGDEQLIIVVLSDHGEELWEREMGRSPDHGHSLYEELLRVPLLFWAPSLIRPGSRFETPVSLLDVAPTLLSLAGLPPDPQHRGRDLSEALTALL